jgi:hypothetical protein
METQKIPSNSLQTQYENESQKTQHQSIETSTTDIYEDEFEALKLLSQSQAQKKLRDLNEKLEINNKQLSEAEKSNKNKHYTDKESHKTINSLIVTNKNITLQVEFLKNKLNSNTKFQSKTKSVSHKVLNSNNSKWSDDEKNYLQKLYQKNSNDYSLIEEKFSKKFPGRTIDSIDQKIERIKKSINGSNRWAKNEVEYLKELYSKYSTQFDKIKKITLEFNKKFSSKTYRAIYQKIERLNLKKNNDTTNIASKNLKRKKANTEKNKDTTSRPLKRKKLDNEKNSTTPNNDEQIITNSDKNETRTLKIEKFEKKIFLAQAYIEKANLIYNVENEKCQEKINKYKRKLNNKNN